MLEESTLVWQREIVIYKKMIKILVIDYQFEFFLDLLNMLVDIKSFTCPRGDCGFNEAFWEEGRQLLFS